MFEHCPKTNTICCFCGKSRYNPHIQKNDTEVKLFCGVARSYDTLVSSLPECWLKMSKYEKSKYTKRKNEEYQTKKNSGAFK
jgi:hypothetical protein|tara:strand:- start:1557 stop:1802 length:246 start_codon:yes stop_codon:yes gene_type:complete